MPQSIDYSAPAVNNYGSLASLRSEYERGDIVLSDVKKENNYDVLRVHSGYSSLPPSADGYGVLQLSEK